MDEEYSGKRAVDGLIVSKRSSGLVLRETRNHGDGNGQFCNRIGCSGRLNSSKGSQVEKAKTSRPSLRSTYSGKEIGSSSRSCAAVSNPRKSFTQPSRKLSSHLETDSSETSSVQDEPEASDPIPPPGKIQRGLHRESKNASSSEVSLIEVGSSSVANNTRSRRNFNQRAGLGNQATLAGSSKNTSTATNASATRYGLRNLKCNSISDVVPSNCSSSDSSINIRRETVIKRNSEGESSSTARGKKVNGPPSGQNPNSNHGITISDSRRDKNMLPNRDNGVASVRTRRSINSLNRGRSTNQGNSNRVSRNESPVVLSRPETPINMNTPVRSAEGPSIRSNSNGRPGNSSRNLRASSLAEAAFARSLVNRDSLRHYNIDGIAEVLLALDRIGNDEEMTFEQMLVLETNMFLTGLYDQHRDMRLDIDNMTYEELLALEERMGTVSTAVPEEALSECLKRSIYQSMPLEDVAVEVIGNKEDVKCSICQEEYADGDEVGRLPCEHSYHVDCVQQWLRLKNWCPICKVSAAPSPSSSSSASTDQSST
ncbi:hypothetical protein UlMin_035597 [Ulmus minor]